MYIPKAFEVEDPAVAVAFMRRHNFATIVTPGASGLLASHVPVILRGVAGEPMTLHAHLARANDHWQSFDGDTEALVVFQGPHAYVSPSLYETHPSVPTWNYQAVHAYGRPVVLDDPMETRAHVLELVAQEEAGAENPWTPDLPETFFEGMLRQIVAIRIDITRIEAKFKLSQNRSMTDRRNVAASFEASSDSTLQALGREQSATLG
jgi:transcriptional regulator